MKALFLILLLELFLFSNEKIKNQEDASLLENAIKKGEIFRDYLSKKLTYYATNIDNYLANKPDDKIYDNPTYMHIQYSSSKSQGSSLESEAIFKIRVRLPKSKNKYKISISNKKESNDKSNDIRVGESKKTTYTQAGVSYVDYIKKELSLKIGGGVKLRINEFDPYVKVKASREFKHYSNWKSELAQKFYYSHDKQFESTSSYEIYKIFSDEFKFSNYNEYFWKNLEKNDNYYNSFRLFQNLSKKKYMSYVVSGTTNDSDSNLQVKNYQTYVSYRHYIRPWMYYDVIPRYIWERSNDFDQKYAINVNFGMLFGKI